MTVRRTSAEWSCAQVTHWQHPQFHAYYPTAHSFAALLGDMLSAGLGCVGFSWVCTSNEHETRLTCATAARRVARAGRLPGDDGARGAHDGLARTPPAPAAPLPLQSDADADAAASRDERRWRHEAPQATRRFQVERFWECSHFNIDSSHYLRSYCSHDTLTVGVAE